MSISNLQETLLMYAKEKSRLGLQFNDIQFNLASATRKTLAAQQQYNNKMSNYYYMYKGNMIFQEEYEDLCYELETEYEFNIKNIDSWEEQLQLDKENIEMKLNEISANETSFRALLKKNIQSDFSYGGGQGQ